jgi:PAS domain S-box-containing protein
MADNTMNSYFSDDRLRATLAAAGASGTWDWDIPAELLYFDEKFAELYGLPVGTGQTGSPTTTFFSAIHPDDRARIKIAVAGMVSGTELFSKEFRIIQSDGAVVWMHGRGQSYLDTNDQPVRFTGILVDVTERKRTEERLRIAQSAGGVGTFEYIEGFATVSVSADFCKLLGLHPTGVLPTRTINGVVEAGHGQIIPDSVKVDDWRAERLEGEFQITRRDDGAHRWIARRGEIVRDSETSSFRLIGVIYDVTASKQNEERLRELNETLEMRVQAETTERLQVEEALRQAQKMEAMGLLTGGIAHDFNNLLMAIMSGLTLAKKRSTFDPRVTPLLDNALQAAERGASLIQRMLLFARRQELIFRSVDIPALINEMVELIERSMGPSYTLQHDFPSNLPLVFTDPDQLASAVLNLAVNARDAMPAGGAIMITAEPVEVDGERTSTLKAGRYVKLSVIDSGEGMDAATLARATEPFYTTKGVGKGTGLGLSMVHGMAAQSGGQLVIKSTPNIGTTVEIWIPQAKHNAEVSSPAPPVEKSPAGMTLFRTILVVYDDALVRMNVVMMLEDLGHSITEVSSGRQALDLLENASFDLVITDHAMPGMTGAQLIEQIRESWPKLPVVLATGYAESPTDIEKAILRLTKPFSSDQLEAVLRAVFVEPIRKS